MIYHDVHNTIDDQNSFNDLRETVYNALTDLTPHAHRFDGIVVTGLSGVE